MRPSDTGQRLCAMPKFLQQGLPAHAPCANRASLLASTVGGAVARSGARLAVALRVAKKGYGVVKNSRLFSSQSQLPHRQRLDKLTPLHEHAMSISV